MTDHTAMGPMAGNGRVPARVPRMEFRLYFALIFALALPVGLVTWTVALVRHGHLPQLGPVARAWCDAKAITPMIFSA
jgi:hypothetical protein